MKKIFRLSFLSTILFFTVMQAVTVSCTKETLIQEKIVKDTVIIRDTVRIPDTLLTAQILTSQSWKLKELRAVNGNTKDYYLRGGTGNINNYDNEYITFNADKTGTYVEPIGKQHSLTWELVTTPRIKIIYNIVNLGTQASTIITWDNILYKNGNIMYEEYFSQGSTNVHVYATRMPTTTF